MSGTVTTDVVLRARIGSYPTLRRQRGYIGSTQRVYFDVLDRVTGQRVTDYSGAAAMAWTPGTFGADSPGQSLPVILQEDGSFAADLTPHMAGTWVFMGAIASPSTETVSLPFDVADPQGQPAGLTDEQWNALQMAGAAAGASAAVPEAARVAVDAGSTAGAQAALAAGAPYVAIAQESAAQAEGYAVASETAANSATAAEVIATDAADMSREERLAAQAARDAAASSATLADQRAGDAELYRDEVTALAGPGAPIYLRNDGTRAFSEFAPSTSDQFDNADKIRDWLLSLTSEKRVGVPLPGTFMASSVSLTSDYFMSDLVIDGRQGMCIKGAPGYAGSVVTLRANATARPRLRIQGMEFDASLRGFSNAAASGSCLSIRDWGQYDFDWCRFLAGDSYKAQVGDSGITINNCDFGSVRRSYFKGHPDKGIYITGGASQSAADDSADHHVDDCLFYRCNTAASATRQAQRFKVTNNTAVECLLGFGRTEAGGDVSDATYVDPGREMIAIGNYLVRTGSRAFRLYAGSGGDVIMGNILVDWGYDFEGGTPTTRDLLDLRGVKDAKILGNTFEMRDWLPIAGSHRAVVMRNHSLLNPVRTEVTSGALIEGNSFVGLAGAVAIVELASTTGNSGTNNYRNCDAPFTRASGSTSLYGVRKSDGTVEPAFSLLNMGKASPLSIASPGTSIDATGVVRATVQGDVVERLNRLGGHGVITQFYTDSVSIGALTSIEGYGLTLAGIPRMPSFTVAELQALPTSSAGRMIVWCSNGANGKGTPAFFDGTLWRRADNGGPLSETAGWRMDVVYSAAVSVTFPDVSPGNRQGITVDVPGAVSSDFVVLNVPSAANIVNIDYRARATTNQVAITANNTASTGNAIAVGTFTVHILVMRPEVR